LEENKIYDSKKIKKRIEKLKIYENIKNSRCQNLKSLIKKCPNLEGKVEIGLLSINPKIDKQEKTIITFLTKFKKL